MKHILPDLQPIERWDKPFEQPSRSNFWKWFIPITGFIFGFLIANIII